MRNKFLLLDCLFFADPLCADDIPFLDVKQGLWES